MNRQLDTIFACSDQPLRVFAQDETRLGLHAGATRRRLTSRGVKPIQRILPRYEYYWLYAAVEPTTGENLFLEMPALDADCFQAFLDEFSRAFPDTSNVLLIDGAPAHVARRLRVPENVFLIRFPPYSPELNPVERLWQDLRKRLGSTLPASLAALKTHAADRLRDYSAATLASITGFPYLRTDFAQSS